MKYLGYIIITSGIQIDPEKVITVTDWEELKNVRNVRSFLSFCNFYKKFIRNFGRIAKPFNDFTKKGASFEITLNRQKTFKSLKKIFTFAPVLYYYSFDRDT